MPIFILHCVFLYPTPYDKLRIKENDKIEKL